MERLRFPGGLRHGFLSGGQQAAHAQRSPEDGKRRAKLLAAEGKPPHLRLAQAADGLPPAEAHLNAPTYHETLGMTLFMLFSRASSPSSRFPTPVNDIYAHPAV